MSYKKKESPYFFFGYFYHVTFVMHVTCENVMHVTFHFHLFRSGIGLMVLAYVFSHYCGR